ncbi:MAG: SpoIID/LytB domain-containing protein [Lachnospiraceae bacterium]|nr:SpoIID/LytB domain-containing protein [Lachnospiraceae bacterium]
MTDIRIGLVDLYKDKSSIMVYNSRIALGFCVGNSYSAEIELDSATGFSFTPDKGTYYEDINNYPSYQKALSICGTYEAGGAKAFPVYAGTGCWKCYITAASYNNLASGNQNNTTYQQQNNNIDQQKSNDSKQKNNLTTDLRKKENTAYLVKIAGQNGTLLVDGEAAGGFPQIKALNPTDGIYSINLGTRSYRGRIEIGRYNAASTLTAVNILNIESYLLGVVTCEMQKTWPEEALKAQAVCSRSYAYLRCGFGADSNIKSPYNVVDTTASQVYRGVQGESPQSHEAVNATIGQIVTSKGKPIDAFFFSTSGGATDSIMDIWGIKSQAYTGVFDFYENYPEKKPWSYDFTIEQATAKINDAGYDIGTLKSIEPFILTESGRVYKAKIRGTKKTVTVSGSKLRSIFGLSDTKLRIITSKSKADNVYLLGADSTAQAKLKDCYVITADGTVKLSDEKSQYILISDRNFYNVPASLPAEGIIRIIGMGWGHGVGMSQSGAMGMAKKGYDYKEIIAFYYNNAEVGEY